MLKDRLKTGKRRRKPAPTALVLTVTPSSHHPKKDEAISPATEQPTQWWKWGELSEQDQIVLALGLVAFFAIMLPVVIGLVTTYTSPR